MKQGVAIKVTGGDPNFYGEGFYKLKIVVTNGSTVSKYIVNRPKIIKDSWCDGLELGGNWSVGLRNDAEAEVCLSSYEGKISIHLSATGCGSSLTFNSTPEIMKSIIVALEVIEGLE